MGEVVPARTSPTLLPHPLALCCNYPLLKCLSASIIIASTLRVNQVNSSFIITVSRDHVVHEKAIIHQLTTMLATSKKSYFQVITTLLTTGTDDLTLWLLPKHQWGAWSSVPVVSRWLWSGNRTFLKVASMEVTWWILAFLRSNVTPVMRQCFMGDYLFIMTIRMCSQENSNNPSYLVRGDIM